MNETQTLNFIFKYNDLIFSISKGKNNDFTYKIKNLNGQYLNNLILSDIDICNILKYLNENSNKLKIIKNKNG